MQLEAIASGPIANYLGEETNTHVPRVLGHASLYIAGCWRCGLYYSMAPFALLALAQHEHSVITALQTNRQTGQQQALLSLGAPSCCHPTQQWPKTGQGQPRNHTQASLFHPSLSSHSHEPPRQHHSAAEANMLLLGKSRFFHTPPEQLCHLQRKMGGVATSSSVRHHVGHIPAVLLSCGHCTSPKQEEMKGITSEVKSLGYLIQHHGVCHTTLKWQ